MNVAVFSFCRYDPHFYEKVLKRKKKRKINYTKDDCRVFLLRSCKVMVHEIAHLFGIVHCGFWSCLMNGSGHLEEDFSQSIHLCPVDLHKVMTLTGSEVRLTYNKLLSFYKKYQCSEEEMWIEGRLSSFEQKDDMSI